MNAPLSNKQVLFAQWNTQAAIAKAAVEAERNLRAQVIEAYSDAQAFPEFASGTESVDIGEGFDLKILHSLDYKLDNANDCERLDKVLDQIEKSMEGGAIIAERLVKWKPELSVSEYKLLAPAQKAMIDTVLTIKPASKSVKVHKRGR
jgi:hypothetical protein